MRDKLVARLAGLCGILPDYYDIWGERHVTPPETMEKILAAMGFEVTDVESLEKEIEARETPPVLEPVIVLKAEEARSFTVHLPIVAETTFKAELKDETGTTEVYAQVLKPEDTVTYKDETFGRFVLSFEREPAPGYYGLMVFAESGHFYREARARLIISPGRCYLPEEHGRSWGLTLSLYSIRSRRNWGTGDLRDLGDIASWIAGQGGDFVGVLPFHALPLPGGVSPYSPITRVYRNFIYIDVEDVPGFDRVRGEVPWDELERLRSTETVDYEGVYEAKRKILRRLFSLFYNEEFLKKTPRGAEFDRYLDMEGQFLMDYATFMALSEDHPGGLMDWPEEYRLPDEGGVREFRDNNPENVLYHAWLQWIMDGQLARLQARAREAGMRAGIYHDLAIGSLGGGSDAWSFSDSFAIGADVGAPPDEFNLSGQNWGFPPMVPHKMRETGYELFIRTIKKNLRHGGILRIDHALALFRLFWIPRGVKPSEGAYVTYPSDELLAIIALESQRQKAAIVAEDLGTVPTEVKEKLQENGMLSYRLFYYERKYPEPDFIAPEKYPKNAFTAITTHDLPTIHGFWRGRDIETKIRLSIYPAEDAYNRDVENRRRDRELILHTLKSRGFLPEGFETPEEMNETLMLAIYGYLAETPSFYTAVSLDDWLGETDQQNMPGTTGGYPNWRRKLREPLESFTNKDGRLAGLFREHGRGR